MAVSVIGAGLAGCEAAYQLAKRGLTVDLYEMKPEKTTPAHRSPGFAELVCSNSLRSKDIGNAVGLLKAEMRLLDSLILRAADAAAVPGGGALAVDRDVFSGYVTAEIRSNPQISLRCREVTSLPEGLCVVATGPLTSEAFAAAIRREIGEDFLHFFDAAAPIVTAESLNLSRTFVADRYGRGEGDYVNCPLNAEEYAAFYEALISAQTAKLRGFEGREVFEGCMPVEVMAARGRDTLRFGPMKPVGLTDPATGRRPYAAVQLRRENAAGSLLNLVGFQTHLTFPEQRRVFGLIPALEHAEFARYGVMHRNTFLNSPRVLDVFYRMKTRPETYFAGQITGVEGYVESAASGLCCGINAARQAAGKPPLDFTPLTAMGALQAHISSPNADFQPMNVNFGLMQGWEPEIRDKAERRRLIAERALGEIGKIRRAL